MQRIGRCHLITKVNRDPARKERVSSLEDVKTMSFIVTIAIYCLYFFTIWASDRAARFNTQNRIWRVLFILMALMMGNRLMGIDKAITEIGRKIAYSEEWYEFRREPQIVLIVIIMLATLGSLAALVRSLRQGMGRTLPVLVGSVLLLLFTLIRMISLHEIDMWLATKYIGISLNEYIEILCLLPIAISSSGSLSSKFGIVQSS